jgi:sterol desaturase/sphingolipid hydroxylase (fatty acid hydroxylase superfamily)
MFNFLNPQASGSTPEQIARWCRQLGWLGLVLQALLGFIPLLVVVMRVLSVPQWQGRGFGLGLWLAILCLAILLFSIYWCFRYTRLAARLEQPERRPLKSTVKQTLKLGLLSNLLILIIGTAIALWRVSMLTLQMLSVPQGATVIAPNQVAGPGALVTPSNMIAIHAMLSTIAAGLVGVIIALLLIVQVGRHRVAQDSFS